MADRSRVIRALRIVVALIVLGTGIGLVVRWRGEEGGPQFTRIEPMKASEPLTAAISFWVALSADNLPQVRLVMTDACLDDIGGEPGLRRLEEAASFVSGIDFDSFGIDRTDDLATKTGEAIASFDVERYDWEADLEAMRSSVDGARPDPEQFDLPPLRMTNQRFVFVEGGWRLDGDCATLRSQLASA